MGNIYVAWGSALRRLGVEPYIPPYSSKRTLSLGTKNSPESICLPYKLILGNFIEAIEGGADYVAMISSPGICRLGEYGAGIQIPLKTWATTQTILNYSSMTESKACSDSLRN